MTGLKAALLVGSLNPAKVNAAQAAAHRCFPHRYSPAQGVNVASGVRDQPEGDNETLRGAVNRVEGMAAAWRLHHHKAEAGRRQNEQQQQQKPDPGQRPPLSQVHVQEQLLQPAASQLQLQCSPDSLLLAVEGGVLQREQDMFCFAWAAAQLAGGGKVSTARSAEFLLPKQLSELVLAGQELGAADDQVFGRVKSGQGSGTVGKLTANLITRAAYYEHAVVMALIPFMNPDLYPEFGLLDGE